MNERARMMRQLQDWSETGEWETEGEGDEAVALEAPPCKECGESPAACACGAHGPGDDWTPVKAGE